MWPRRFEYQTKLNLKMEKDRSILDTESFHLKKRTKEGKKMSNKIMLVLVLNKIEALDNLLVGLSESGLPSATVLNSTGMMQQLASLDEERIIATLRPFMTANHTENKTMFMILEEEQVAVAKQVIEREVGDLSKPETAILFGLPVLFTEGIRTSEHH